MESQDCSRIKPTNRALVAHNVRCASTLLYIFDPLSKTSFLIDAGAEVSVLPAMASQHSLPLALHLYAVNSTKIPVFLHKTMMVELSLCRSFEWTFYVAAGSQALLHADFLQHCGLLVDIQNRQLVDPFTSLATHVQPTPGAVPARVSPSSRQTPSLLHF